MALECFSNVKTAEKYKLKNDVFCMKELVIYNNFGA